MKQEHIEHAQGWMELYSYKRDVCPTAHAKLAEWLNLRAGGDNRGLLLAGGFGTGKTEFCKRFLNSWKLRRAIDIATMYSNHGTGDVLNEWVHGVYATGSMRVDPWDVVIDDVGQEGQAKHYGESVEVLGQIMEQRYGYWLECGARTAITTNMDYKQMTARYGLRTMDRMLHMCYVVKFDAPSARGRS